MSLLTLDDYLEWGIVILIVIVVFIFVKTISEED